MTATFDGTVHARVVGVRHSPIGLGVSIDFEVLDEGPHLGELVSGKPENSLWKWIRAAASPQAITPGAAPGIEDMLNRPCRIVVGLTGNLRRRSTVRDVLPA